MLVFSIVLLTDAGLCKQDGWMFRHYLDSPEQGLLMLTYWGDVGPRSGGTFIAPVRPHLCLTRHLLVPIRLICATPGLHMFVLLCC